MLEKRNQMLLVNLVFAETYCNQKCHYCAYPKRLPQPLAEKDLKSAEANIKLLRKFIKENFSDVRIISITGGEPLLFPEIIDLFCKHFFDKWIRLSTNGLLLNAPRLAGFKKYKKLFFAVSLDGYDLPMNSHRFSSISSVNTVIKKISLLLENGFPVEILTTLHRHNINKFEKFSKYLDGKYLAYIKQGKISLLASPIVNYHNLALEPTARQKVTFIKGIISNKTAIINRNKNYYRELSKFYRHDQRRNHCQMFDWSFSIKYLANSLWEDGKFLLYGCGCRGIKVLGQMDLTKKYEDKIIIERVKSKLLKNFFLQQCRICRKQCFNNWQQYDLFLKDPKANSLSADLAGQNNYE